MPVLNAGKQVRVTLLRTLDPSVLKSTHVVYVGYLSGLGMLGGSFDELQDLETGKTYVSTAMPMGTEGGAFRDFGYFSTFDGPAHNRIVIISGTRDNGVMHVAETLSQRAGVEEVGDKAGGAESFESLYEVDGMARAGLNAHLLFVAKLQGDSIWNGTP